MMKRVAVADGNFLTALGDLEQTWRGLLDGRSGLKKLKLQRLSHELPLGVITSISGSFGSRQRLQSLLEVLLHEIKGYDRNTRLFCASTKGAVDELLTCPDRVEGQPWQVAAYISDRLGLEDRGSMVSGACASGLLATIQAGMAIMTGQCDRALVVAVDLLAEFIVAGFDSLKSLSTGGASPFDVNRDGLSLGEAGGWLLLAAEETLDPGETVLAYLDNWAISCDATHITAPCRHASGLKRALGQLLKDKDVDVGGVNAHGTGTIYNDAMELLAFDEMFGGLPVCSVKGALGHTLAAAGVVETLLSVKSLEWMKLPPTVGLVAPQTSACTLSGGGTLAMRCPLLVNCNSGFGGINAAVLMSR